MDDEDVQEGLASNKFDSERKMRVSNSSSHGNNQENWEEQAEDLLEWSSALDFDEYLQEWAGLGTSGPSNQAHYEKSVLVDNAMANNFQTGIVKCTFNWAKVKTKFCLAMKNFEYVTWEIILILMSVYVKIECCAKPYKSVVHEAPV